MVFATQPPSSLGFHCRLHGATPPTDAPQSQLFCPRLPRHLAALSASARVHLVSFASPRLCDGTKLADDSTLVLHAAGMAFEGVVAALWRSFRLSALAPFLSGFAHWRIPDGGLVAGDRLRLRQSRSPLLFVLMAH